MLGVNAGKLAVVVGELLGDAHSLREESCVVFKMQDAG